MAERTARLSERTGGGGGGVAAPTLFHFTVDPVASFRSLELDLIKIRAAEALTPPIKSSNRSRLPVPRRLSPPSPPLEWVAAASPFGENRHSARERYPAIDRGRGGPRVHKGEPFGADLARINRPLTIALKNAKGRLANLRGDRARASRQLLTRRSA